MKKEFSFIFKFDIGLNFKSRLLFDLRLLGFIKEDYTDSSLMGDKITENNFIDYYFVLLGMGLGIRISK